MPSFTGTKHNWGEPNEEGIARCLDCPCLRKLEGRSVWKYKPRKTADWTKTNPPCTATKGRSNDPRATRADQRAKTCTTVAPLMSESEPAASKT